MKNSIVKSTIQVTVIVFIIKVMGFIKQSVVASISGATRETDIYFMATSVIMALCLVCFSSISVSFLSMYSERLTLNGHDEANNLLNSVLRFFVPISICVALIFFCFSHQISIILAPSYDLNEIKTLSKYIRYLSIMFIFFCYYLIINVVLEVEKLFLPGKGQNFFQNLFTIIAAVFFYRYYKISALIYAFIFAGFIQCIQITWSARKFFKIKKNIHSERKSIQKLISISQPLVVGNAIYEINDIVDKRIASGLREGSISTLAFGASINEIVTTLVISSLSTILFTHFSIWVAEGKKEKIQEVLINSLEYLLVVIMPIMIMCLVCSDCIIEILYGRGNFGKQEIISTSGVVMGYAVGFFFQATRANIIRVYYAFQETKRPMINGLISVTINVVLSIILSRYLGVAGIALATSISMMIATLLLIPYLYRFFPNFSIVPSTIEFLKVMLVSLIIGILANIMRNKILAGSLLTILLVGCFVVISYMILLMIIKVKCIKRLITRK